MRNIQEVGLEILGNNPAKIYVFVGPEYGIKSKYIECLSKYYGSKVEADSLAAVIKTMKTKRILPLSPAVYVVRYDEDFISTLNDKTQEELLTCNVIGTIVCIYDQPKHASKLSKYLPDLTVSIDSVNSHYVEKYLHSDFPDLNDRFIKLSVNSSSDYNQAKNICRCMINGPIDEMYKLSDDELVKIFGYEDKSSENILKLGIASKDFNFLCNQLDEFDGEVQSIFYTILSTMIEIDKCMDSRNIQSDIKKYINIWTREDIYFMFMNTYDMLIKCRSWSISNTKDCILYLFGLLKFNRIPSPEAMI